MGDTVTFSSYSTVCVYKYRSNNIVKSTIRLHALAVPCILVYMVQNNICKYIVEFGYVSFTFIQF